MTTKTKTKTKIKTKTATATFTSATDNNQTAIAPPFTQLPAGQWLFSLTTACILGGGAGLPYAQPGYAAASKLPVTVPGLGYLFGGSTILAYGCAATWGWENMINQVWLRQHNGQLSCFSTYTRDVGGAFLLAAGSGAINFYIVSKYDHSLFYSCLTAVAFAGIDATGYYKLISYGTQSRHSSLRAVRNASRQEELLKKLIMVFPVGNLIVNSYMSYQAGLILVENKFAAMPFALLSLSSFALDIFSAYESVEQLFSSQQDAPEFVLTKQQKLAKLLLQVMTMTVIAFATSSDAFIASDNFGANVAGDTLAALAIGSGVMLGQYVMRDLVNQSMLYFFKPKAAPPRLTEDETAATPVSRALLDDPATPLLRGAVHQA